MPFKDPEEQRRYRREYFRRRRASDPAFKEREKAGAKRRKKRWSEESKELVREFRAAGCRYCGEKTECCLAAHHLDPDAKDFSIAKAISRRLPVNRVAKELAKCVCVCHNCHAKIHAGVIETLALAA